MLTENGEIDGELEYKLIYSYESLALKQRRLQTNRNDVSEKSQKSNDSRQNKE